MGQATTAGEARIERVGGVCAILLGILSALAGVLYLFVPSDQRLGLTAAELLPAFAAGGGALRLELVVLALIGVLGLAVVPALSRLVPDNGWIRWTATIALVGYAVSFVSNLFTLERLPRVAGAFVAGDPSTQAALAAVWKASFDPWGVAAFTGVGVWILTLSLFSLGARAFPVLLSYVGMVLGAVFIVIPLVVASAASGLILATAIVAAVAAVVWFVWAGNVALRAATYR